MLDNALPLFIGDSVPELIRPFRAIAQSLDSILQIPRIPFVEATLTHRDLLQSLSYTQRGSLHEPDDFVFLLCAILHRAAQFYSKPVKLLGSSHKSVHDFRQWEIAEAVVEISDVNRGGPKSIGFVDDDFSLVVQSLYRSVVDRHSKIVQDVVLVSA